MVQKLLNKKFTLKDLIELCKPNQDLVSKWKLYYELDKELNPAHSNGRVNHAWLQQMICDLSNGLITYGGQGKKSSDCYVSTKKVETKAFNVNDKNAFHCAASSFFATNCKVPKYRQLMESNKDAARKFVFEHSYDKNDFYLFTGTASLSCNFNDIVLVLIEKKYLVECLEDNLIKVKMSKINQKLKEINEEKIYA